MKLKILESGELLDLARHIFGTRDGLRPLFPRNAVAIQAAMESAARTQLKQDRNNILEIIRDWDRCASPETENGEEEFEIKYGKDTTHLIDVIKEAVQD